MEQDIEIIPNGKFKNINLKTKYKRDSQNNLVIEDGKKVIIAQGLDDGNYITVKKTKFAEGRRVDRPTYTFFSCGVEYKGEEVSFILYEDDHAKFASCGGLDDTIKISLKKELKLNKKTGQDILVDNLYFEIAND